MYAEVATLTNPTCTEGFRECSVYKDKPNRCCERKYCEIAKNFAKEKYGIELEPTGHPELLFMGKQGCVVPPHLRPICAIHACSWSYGHNCLRNEAETKRYNELRKEILELSVQEDKYPFQEGKL